MSASVTIELPEDVLVDALRQLPRARQRQLLAELAQDEPSIIKTIPASELDDITGLISIGGDALSESEQLYDD